MHGYSALLYVSIVTTVDFRVIPIRIQTRNTLFMCNIQLDIIIHKLFLIFIEYTSENSSNQTRAAIITKYSYYKQPNVNIICSQHLPAKVQ